MRVRDLETALSVLQSKVSDQPHSLLRDELVQMTAAMAADSAAFPMPSYGLVPSAASPHSNGTNGSSSNSANSPPSDQFHDQEEVKELEAFGTLTIGSGGEMAFYGNTARTEYLIRVSTPCLHNDFITKCLSTIVQAPVIPAQPDAQAYPDLSNDLLAACFPEPEIALVNDKVKNEMLAALPSLSEATRLAELYMEHGQYA